MQSRKFWSATFVLFSLVLFGCDKESQQENQAAEQAAANTTVKAEPKKRLIVYSSRNEHLIKPLFEQYTAETGVKIDYITDSAGPLIARLEAEGERTNADLFITVDAGNLWYAAHRGILMPLDSEVLNNNVPASLRDEQGRWYGLSERARTIVYSTERVKPEELSTYEALADEQFKGRLCLRTSKKVYNQSLVATMIVRLGEEEAEKVVKGWVNNLATDVFSNDTNLMEAIAAGQCDVGIVNTYYFGRLQEENPDIKMALFWPNQETSGVHVNVSGAGVTRYAPHKEEAIKLLEWLSSKEAQEDFAGLNHEYPVLKGVPVSDIVKSWGDFKRDPINISKAGELQADAVKLMDRAGYL